MTAGIVLAGGRSSRMGAPKAWLDWHGSTLLRRTCGLVARGTGGPVVVVRAPGQPLPDLPPQVRVVEDAREGRGPLQGLLAGLNAVDSELAFVASTDMPFLHPRFVAAVCASIDDADAAVPYLDGARQPLAAAYRTALAPLVADMVEHGQLRATALLDRCNARTLDQLPHPESVRNVNDRADYEAALREPQPTVVITSHGTVRAATLGAAAKAANRTLTDRIQVHLNGEPIAPDPQEPLAEGDELTFASA
ncbi:MAG TPA: molybdenum cofactor guanylyltransferase [Solirubrobacter sp.]|nr:molybdenum cofactor guanylyltransferase [Solirubrobacter sp.]